MSLTTTIATVNDHHPLSLERLAEVDAPPVGYSCRDVRSRTSSRAEVRVVVTVEGETGNTVTTAAATNGAIISVTLDCCSSKKIQFDLYRINCCKKTISILEFVFLVI